MISVGFPGAVQPNAAGAEVPQPSYKTGTVSSRQVDDSGIARTEVSATMGSGMSGGPTVNSAGEVIGTNSCGNSLPGERQLQLHHRQSGPAWLPVVEQYRSGTTGVGRPTVGVGLGGTAGRCGGRGGGDRIHRGAAASPVFAYARTGSLHPVFLRKALLRTAIRRMVSGVPDSAVRPVGGRHPVARHVTLRMRYPGARSRVGTVNRCGGCRPRMRRCTGDRRSCRATSSSSTASTPRPRGLHG